MADLRYLEQFDLRLVRLDLRERETLLRSAPHLVKALEFLTPFFGRQVGRVLKLLAGLALYDALSFDKSRPSRRWLTAAEARAADRSLDREDVTGAAAYYDARVDCAERLALENVLDAERHGARVFNYCEALRIEKESNTQIAATLRVRDVLDGDETQFGAKVAVNATGAWVDPVAATLTGRQPYAIRTTKGIRLDTARRHTGPGCPGHRTRRRADGLGARVVPGPSGLGGRPRPTPSGVRSRFSKLSRHGRLRIGGSCPVRSRNSAKRVIPISRQGQISNFHWPRPKARIRKSRSDPVSTHAGVEIRDLTQPPYTGGHEMSGVVVTFVWSVAGGVALGRRPDAGFVRRPAWRSALLPGMGVTDMPVTTTPGRSRPILPTGRLAIPSFWFVESGRSFLQAALEPDMAMAYSRGTPRSFFFHLQ